MSDIVANRGSELSVSSLGASIARAVSAAIAAAHRVVSIGYLFLRATTALGALFAGLVQTFVFARVLTPAQFAVFVLLASFGVSLALLDFGVVKLFFVRLRAAYLAGRIPTAIARTGDRHCRAVCADRDGVRIALRGGVCAAADGVAAGGAAVHAVLPVCRAQFRLVCLAQYQRGDR